MAETIKGMKLSDGTEINVAGLTYTTVTSKGNLEISTPLSGKMNLESYDNMCMKPGGKVQLDTHKYSLSADRDEFKIAVINDSKTKVEGLKLETAGIKIVTGDADTGMGWDPDTFKVLVKKTTGSTDTWSKMNLHASSIDLRTRTIKEGTGGGIAAQIASCDSKGNENKFKIETSRKKDVFDGTATYDSTSNSVTNWSTFYNQEGGTGVEIGTINSQFESFYTKELRRAANTDVFATYRIFEPITTFYDPVGAKVELDSTGADGSKKAILVAELNDDGMWDSKAIKLADQDCITYVSSGSLSGWYKGSTCKSSNKIMSFNLSVETVPTGEENDYVLAPNGKYYQKFSLSKNNMSSKVTARTKSENKQDYVTQKDDSKDVKMNGQGSVKWIDLINAALYLKAQGLIPSDGSLYS